MAATVGTREELGYASGFYDSNTELYHFGARYYDPSLGRWTQQDPVAGSLGDLGSADRYAYANDDPVNMVDPSGKSASPGCLAAIAFAAPSAWGFLQAVWGYGVDVILGGWEEIMIAPEFFEWGAFIILVGVAILVIGTAIIAAGYYLAVASACGWSLSIP